LGSQEAAGGDACIRNAFAVVRHGGGTAYSGGGGGSFGGGAGEQGRGGRVGRHGGGGHLAAADATHNAARCVGRRCRLLLILILLLLLLLILILILILIVIIIIRLILLSCLLDCARHRRGACTFAACACSRPRAFARARACTG